MNNIMAVILAAGEGKRMKSNNSKVVHKILGKPLVKCVYDSLKEAGVSETITVVGHKAEQVKEILGDRSLYAEQKEQLGTGHAVMQAVDYLKGKKGKVFVVCGDTPLITSDTMKNTIESNLKNNEYATIITAEFDDPTGYGRIVRDGKNNIVGIVEHKDTTDEQRAIKEINSGMYLFDIESLIDALKELKNDNVQHEYYLTDVIGIMISKNLKVGSYIVTDNNEVMGINDRIQLEEAGQIARAKLIKYHLQNGVTMIDKSSTYIDFDVEIGKDTIIYPNCMIESGTVIGENCIIGPSSKITESKIGDGVSVMSSVLIQASVGDETTVGPFAYLRPNSNIGKKARIGDFVEIKNSNIGNGTKVSHLTYVGDSDVGEKVNFGCGTVTVNYDGKNKFRTTIEDNAFIGCNTNLVAPVTVKAGAYTAAGTTITKEVPEDALAIGRVRQENKEGWAGKKRRE